LSKGKKPKVVVVFPLRKESRYQRGGRRKVSHTQDDKRDCGRMSRKKTFSFSLYNDKSRKGVKISGMENKFRVKVFGE
jgi:hypothetical protein